MSQKLWLNMLLSFVNGQFGQFGQIIKNHFFLKQKFEIVFSDLYVHGNLLIVPF